MLTAHEIERLLWLLRPSMTAEDRDRALLAKLEAMREACSWRRGAKVFELRLPLECAPTMNVFSSMKGWQKAKLRKDIDLRILAVRPLWRRWPHGGRRRLAVVTRHSSRRVDEVSCDTAGAKAALDRLAIGGVFAGDAAKDLEREAFWLPAQPKAGELVVDVYELESVGVANGES